MVRKQTEKRRKELSNFFVLFCFVLFLQEAGWALLSLIGMLTNLSNANIRVSSWLLKGNV